MKNFSQFYCGLREYFSSHSKDYERFKTTPNEGKTKYLLQHPVVQAALENLAQEPVKKAESPKGTQSTQIAVKEVGNLGKTHSKYPQMSAKVSVKSSARRGRFLVANQRINPGKLRNV